jgi:ATP-dependent Lon protease
MEIIEIPGYILDEKRIIARRYLLPRQLAANGIAARQLALAAPAVDAIIEGYTREAGVRELERLIGRVCRKVATRVAESARPTRVARAKVGPGDLGRYLGPRRFHSEMDALATRPGLAVGLAWTPTGGDVLFIEAVSTPGTGQLKLTGRLGEVMAESAYIARTVVRARAAALGIDDAVFTKADIHLHVPAGAVPKDGPSAGITLATALVSLLTGKTIARRLAMTGELTLRGVVTPIGGLRNKLVAAKRAGVRTVVIPAGNRPDLDEVPERVRRGLTIVFAEELDDALVAAGLMARPKARRRITARARRRPR